MRLLILFRLDWYHGTVTEIVNKNKSSVKIKWDDNCLHDNDMKISTNVLLIVTGVTEYPLLGETE